MTRLIRSPLAVLLRRQHGRHRAPQPVVVVAPRMPCRHGLFGCDHCRPTTFKPGAAPRTAAMTPTLLDVWSGQ